MVEVVKYGATGRRKCSVARVNITPGTGVIRVNKRTFENYFPRETDRINIIEPLTRTNTLGKVDISVSVTGGGSTGQAGAFRLGLSRALTLFDQENRPILKKALLLRRDSRMKERQKPGQKGARKKFQWVKR
ncbi:MAG: 30S ribosomal protein S9 [Candidatus Omnitrophica bacterium]|nr:30S ribosomal protein S9 [Candidatus Omnitrophota bacterium]MBU1996675.1 30S ribosomal protein S9 [Candidatus Omnitrophota bacterium]MBU4333784.1 30S ribosomal protein S9 [Candidatus Omnitrophota bacterium]